MWAGDTWSFYLAGILSIALLRRATLSATPGNSATSSSTSSLDDITTRYTIVFFPRSLAWLMRQAPGFAPEYTSFSSSLWTWRGWCAPAGRERSSGSSGKTRVQQRRQRIGDLEQIHACQRLKRATPITCTPLTVMGETTTTQGDPMEMAAYMPWPCSLRFRCFGMNYGKRGLSMTTTGELLAIRRWWIRLCELGTLVWLLYQCREVMACGEAGVSAQSWKAVCRSWSADNFCWQALPGRGDWLSRLCSRVFGGVESRVAGTSGAPSQSVNPTQRMQILSTASQQNGATFNVWFLQSNLPLIPGKRRSRRSFCRRWRVRALYHSIHDVSSLSLLVWAA